jgi:hypothetical protein
MTVKLKCIRCEIVDKTYYLGFQTNSPVMYFHIQLALENGKPESHYVQKGLEKLKPIILENLKTHNEEPVLNKVFEI